MTKMGAGRLLLLAAASMIMAGFATTAASAADVIKIRVTDETPVGHFIDTTMRNWAKRVEKETNGRVQVEIFSNSQLYSDREAVRALARGDLEMNVSVTAWMAQVEPKMLVLSLPYMFDSTEDFIDIWNSDVGHKLSDLLLHRGVVALAMWPSGQHVLATKTPLLKMEDFRGRKLRVSGGKPYEAAIAALGGSAVTLPTQEVPMAVETGVVDGINGALSFWAANYPEALPNAIEINMWHSGFGVWANATFWNSLPPDIKKIMTDAMADATKQELVLVKEQENKTSASAKAKGAKILVLSPEEEKRWKAATKDVYKQFPNLVDLATAVMKK
jgi:C4-dicarboxylate-binding protein DctP